MEISKVQKPLHVHFYPKYEIRSSALSGLHVEFAEDEVQPITCQLYCRLIYRRLLDNPWKVDGSTACMYDDTTTHVSSDPCTYGSTVYICAVMSSNTGTLLDEIEGY
jgi:hypothetical protein